MVLQIYDKSLNRCGFVDEITSLIWTRKYWESGDFKLLVPYTKHNLELLQMNRLIIKQGDDEAGEIKYIKLRKKTNHPEEIEIQGKFITSWLGNRIIENQILVSDTTYNIIKRIVNENIVSPIKTARRIPNLFLDPNMQETVGSKVEYVSEPFASVQKACEDLAKNAKLGIKIFSDIKAKKFYFKIYKGVERTSDQSTNKRCVFSKERENILDQEFTDSVEPFKNFAYVGGEESKEMPRSIIEIGDVAGHERVEYFENASDVKLKYKDANNNEITIPSWQYNEMLRQRGNVGLSNRQRALSFDGDINPNADLIYKIDYDVGDRITTINKKWGIKINERITEVEEVYDKNGFKIKPKFGESIPTFKI